MSKVDLVLGHLDGNLQTPTLGVPESFADCPKLPEAQVLCDPAAHDTDKVETIEKVKKEVEVICSTPLILGHIIYLHISCMQL